LVTEHDRITTRAVGYSSSTCSRLTTYRKLCHIY
jgi:hypothetical protein